MSWKATEMPRDARGTHSRSKPGNTVFSKVLLLAVMHSVRWIRPIPRGFHVPNVIILMRWIYAYSPKERIEHLTVRCIQCVVYLELRSDRTQTSA